MKKLILAIFMMPLFVMGQKYKVIDGDLSAIATVKEMNVAFDYSETKYYNENMSEEAYIERRIKDKNGEDVNEIQSEWQKTKEIRIPDKVLSIVKKYDARGVKYTQDGDASITMIVKPQWIYPGWFAAVMKQPSKLNVNYEFVDASGKSLVTIQCTKAIGDIYPVGIPNTNNRIAEAYAHSTKGLMKFMKKKIK